MSRFWCDAPCGEPRTADPLAPRTPNGLPLCPECGSPMTPLDTDPLNLTDTIEGGIA